MRRIKSFEGVEMREKRKRILVVFFTVYTVLSANAQGQGTTTGLTVGKFADIGQMLGAFSKNNAGRLNISADMGLNWSDSYIGELIHIPPHFGFGLSLVMNGVKNDNFNRLLSETLGTPAIDAWFAQKQFFPNYLIECRIGGFRDLPFDIGLKVGYIPTVSFIFSDYGYNNLQFGGDIRYNFLSSYSGLKMSMSVGVGYVNGYFSKSDYNISWSPTGQASPVTNVLDPKNSEMRVRWDTLSFSLKYLIGKTFRGGGFTIFGSAATGYGATSTGLRLIGENATWGGQAISNQNPSTAWKNIQDTLNSQVANGSQWNIGAGDGSKISIAGDIDNNVLALYGQAGIAFDFMNDIFFQLSGTFDFLNLEYGFALSFRWQQRSLF